MQIQSLHQGRANRRTKRKIGTMNALRWGSGIPLAAFLVFMGSQKFTTPNPVFSYIAEQSGMAIFEPTIRLLVGVSELAAAALILTGLFLGMARGLGGVLSLGVIGGAIVFHLSPWLGVNAPMAYDEAGAYVTSPMLFVMALVFFAFSAVQVFAERDHVPILGDHS
jgi:hypothetical protein